MVCVPVILASHTHTRFLFNDPATTEIYTLSLHDALPILRPVTSGVVPALGFQAIGMTPAPKIILLLSKIISPTRSEEHTSELQSRVELVCRLLLEKKK